MSPILLKDEIARRKIVFRVMNFSEMSSMSSKGARERPFNKIAISQVGTLVQTAGLSLKGP